MLKFKALQIANIPVNDGPDTFALKQRTSSRAQEKTGLSTISSERVHDCHFRPSISSAAMVFFITQEHSIRLA